MVVRKIRKEKEEEKIKGTKMRRGDIVRKEDKRSRGEREEKRVKKMNEKRGGEEVKRREMR